MGDRKHNEMLAGLSETFDAICFISRSIKCSIITKEELLHKILSNNLEIEETSMIFFDSLFLYWNLSFFHARWLTILMCLHGRRSRGALEFIRTSTSRLDF